MCNVTPGAGRTQSHHIWPKALYPEDAYSLWNGICLCVRCHKGVVHAELIHDRGNWEKFVPMFADMMFDKMEWNDREQHRILLLTDGRETARWSDVVIPDTSL